MGASCGILANNGSYAINGLRPGVYKVTFQLDGFQTAEQSEVEMRVGQESRLNVELKVGEITETITIEPSTHAS